MGLFHKNLKQAKAYVEKGMISEALGILSKHYDEHISDTMNKELHRLHTHLGNYMSDINALIGILQNKKGDYIAAFNQNWEEAEKNLKGMDKEIKSLIKLKKTELE